MLDSHAELSGSDVAGAQKAFARLWLRPALHRAFILLMKRPRVTELPFCDRNARHSAANPAYMVNLGVIKKARIQ